MAENGATLTTKQQRALASLVAAKSIGEAAANAGISERTLTRWLADPAFRAALSLVESELIDSAVRHLLGLQGTAIAVLEDILTNPDVPASVKLRAATSTLDILLRLREMASLERRLTALEQKAVKGKPVAG